MSEPVNQFLFDRFANGAHPGAANTSITFPCPITVTNHGTEPYYERYIVASQRWFSVGEPT